MKTWIIATVFVALSFFSCSVSKANQEQSQTNGYGYLTLAGSMNNRQALIDGYEVGIDPEDDTNTRRLKAGIHKLEIRSSNRILLFEEINIQSGQTLQVTIP
jgi:hypothetical protein